MTISELLQESMTPKYCWKYFLKNELEDILLGEDIQKHLEQCEAVCLFCATLGQQADELIRRAQVKDISEGFTADTLASNFIEEFCDKAEKEIISHFPGKYFTWRFSPGYGDMPLSVQGNFLSKLNAEKRIGVHVHESGLLIPLKSVTAVIGISEKPLPVKKKGCAICQLAESCTYRKKGEHCN